MKKSNDFAIVTKYYSSSFCTTAGGELILKESKTRTLVVNVRANLDSDRATVFLLIP